MENLVVERMPERAFNCTNKKQSATSTDDLPDAQICRRCGIPMKLIWRSRMTGTRQTWVCRKCLIFKSIRLAEYKFPEWRNTLCQEKIIKL